ncbi:MAG: hypothetical protein EBS89_12535 [Proteobacteria bacterium]|nr:hypothetical protein [Pseudomonadota bacterium]
MASPVATVIGASRPGTSSTMTPRATSSRHPRPVTVRVAMVAVERPSAGPRTSALAPESLLTATETGSVPFPAPPNGVGASAAASPTNGRSGISGATGTVTTGWASGMTTGAVSLKVRVRDPGVKATGAPATARPLLKPCAETGATDRATPDRAAAVTRR